MDSTTLEHFVNQIISKLKELEEELPKVNNKSAMRRCRRRTIELEKMFKIFRKETIKKEKGDK